MRRTVRSSAEFAGIGLHGGQQARLSIRPSEAGCGIRFRRTDVPTGTGDVPARYDLANDTRLCTKLNNEHGVTVGTVEHVMAALSGCGITDALLLLDGPEVPIMDGSSLAFVRGIAAAGIAELGVPARAIRILEPVEVFKDGKRARLEPADRFSVAFSIAFDDPAIGEQAMELDVVNGAFAEELADCRTFGHFSEVEHLRKAGLARGGSLKNAIVIDNGRVLNPGGLRRPDEFVRHKMLDAIGDLALAGAPILGRYVGDRAGHEMTNLLLRALFACPEAWDRVAMPDGAGPGGMLTAPPLPGEPTALAG